jgi:tRNA(adenine34) deaminase
MFGASQYVWDKLYEVACQAALKGEVPVAAAIVQAGEIIAIAHNAVELQNNPCAHAEMLVIQEAVVRIQNKYLSECDLYVTLEPCAMCAGAIAHSRLRRLYFGAYDAKAGAVESGIKLLYQTSCHHHPEIIGGVQEQRFSALLVNFFQHKRNYLP